MQSLARSVPARFEYIYKQYSISVKCNVFLVELIVAPINW